MARAFVGVLAAVLDHRPSTLQFVFYFALFLSLTMELGIWIAFEHLTLASLPITAAAYSERLHSQRRAMETDSELHDLRMDDELLRAKVRRKRQSIEDALHAAESDKLSKRHSGRGEAL